jgi:hypothetical protein
MFTQPYTGALLPVSQHILACNFFGISIERGFFYPHHDNIQKKKFHDLLDLCLNFAVVY